MKNSRTTASKQTLNIWSVWSAVFVEFEKMFAEKNVSQWDIEVWYCYLNWWHHISQGSLQKEAHINILFIID